MEKLVDNLLKEDSESSTYVLPKLRFRMLMEYLPRFISDEIRIFYKYLSYMSEFKKRYKIRNLITNAILDEGYFGIRGLKIIKGVFRRKANNHFFGKSDIRDENFTFSHILKESKINKNILEYWCVGKMTYDMPHRNMISFISGLKAELDVYQDGRSILDWYAKNRRFLNISRSTRIKFEILSGYNDHVIHSLSEYFSESDNENPQIQIDERYSIFGIGDITPVRLSRVLKNIISAYSDAKIIGTTTLNVTEERFKSICKNILDFYNKSYFNSYWADEKDEIYNILYHMVISIIDFDLISIDVPFIEYLDNFVLMYDVNLIKVILKRDDYTILNHLISTSDRFSKQFFGDDYGKYIKYIYDNSLENNKKFIIMAMKRFKLGEKELSSLFIEN